MAEHHVSIMVKAPVHQVYELFTHFDDFPKFMRFVKEVTYYDKERSHWVVQVLGQYEWDAVNENWITDQQIGWRSTNGLQNTGKVKFVPVGPNQTTVDVYVRYLPPSGVLGVIGDSLVGNSRFDTALREDLENFARMVELSPPGALDPMSSHYLFHSNSAFVRGTITNRQKLAMESDPQMSPAALAEREARIGYEKAKQREAEKEQEAAKQQTETMRQVLLEQHSKLEREGARRRQEQREKEQAERLVERFEPHPVHDTIGGRNASRDRTAFGDQDGWRRRHPNHEQGPMLSRLPIKSGNTTKPLVAEVTHDSPWRDSIRGTDSCPL